MTERGGPLDVDSKLAGRAGSEMSKRGALSDRRFWPIFS